ncbi:cation efflux family protein [Pontibacter ummariensis]|uniref:Cation efflux family protein n=1 Tax=Pontibacter ummariensis TaxID=1610492 RepID=A0A239JAN3_9BACT|nr:cation transporter [Pontibacter ummariensis]PRY08335.1 cation efflux family protein [Pontibacter ummariensis]SNT02920.1 Cation efflux family protein [Pontibacter ummariensis]
MSDKELDLNLNNRQERQILIKVTWINFSQVALAGIVGFIISSSSLLGTALDSSGDMAVYLVSLYAVGKSMQAKVRAATFSGIFLMGVGVLLLVDVINKFLEGSEPVGWAMIVVAIINTASNYWIVRLLKSNEKGDVHIKASIIFTDNDMWINLGIVVSGLGVMLLKSSIPDLVVGVIVVLISLWGGYKILKEAQETKKNSKRPNI